MAILASLTATSALEMRPSRAQLMQLASHVVRGQTMPKIGVVGGRDGSVSLIKNKPRMCCCRSEYATLCGALAAAQFGLGGRGFISLPHPGWRPGVIGLIRTSRPPSYCGVHPARGGTFDKALLYTITHAPRARLARYLQPPHRHSLTQFWSF